MESLAAYLTPKQATSFIQDDATLRQAIERFDVHRFTIVPIVDEQGKYVGSLSQGDLLHAGKQAGFSLQDAERIRICDIEKYRPYKALSITATMKEVFALSMEQNFIPICDDKGTYIGIIKRRDVLRFAKSILSAEIE